MGGQLAPHRLPGAVTTPRAGDLYDLPRLVQTPGLDLAALPNDGGDQGHHLPAQLGAGVGHAVLRVALAHSVDLATLGPTHRRLLSSFPSHHQTEDQKAEELHLTIGTFSTTLSDGVREFSSPTSRHSLHSHFLLGQVSSVQSLIFSFSFKETFCTSPSFTARCLLLRDFHSQLTSCKIKFYKLNRSRTT